MPGDGWAGGSSMISNGVSSGFTGVGLGRGKGSGAGFGSEIGMLMSCLTQVMPLGACTIRARTVLIVTS